MELQPTELFAATTSSRSAAPHASRQCTVPRCVTNAIRYNAIDHDWGLGQSTICRRPSCEQNAHFLTRAFTASRMTAHALFDDSRADVVHVITPCDLRAARQQQQQQQQPSSSPVAHIQQRNETITEGNFAHDEDAHDDDDEHENDGDFEFTLLVLSVCGRRVELSSTRLRGISSLALIPTILTLVWLFPAKTTIFLATMAAFVGFYEFAWLAFRIQSRLLETYRHYEDEDSKKAQRRRQLTRVTVAVHRETVAAANAGTPELPQLRLVMLELPNVYPHRCAVRSAAEKFFCGKQWAAALVLAIPLAGLLVAIDVLVIESFMLTELPTELSSNESFHWTFLVSTRYVASVCGLFCPNWGYVVLLVVEVAAFSIMTSQTLLCPMGNFVCSQSGTTVSIFTVFAMAVAAILFLSVLSSGDAVEIVVKSMLHILGFTLVFALALATLSLVDDVAMRASRGFLTALLAVVWTGDCGAFCWNLVRKSIQWGQSPLTPTRTHVDPRRDIECTLVATGAGALMMAVLTQLIVLPRGSIQVFIVLAVGAIIFGRMGDLLLGILKKAAAVGRSGALFPGLGGALDQTISTSFAALVFAQYAGQL